MSTTTTTPKTWSSSIWSGITSAASTVAGAVTTAFDTVCEAVRSTCNFVGGLFSTTSTTTAIANVYRTTVDAVVGTTKKVARKVAICGLMAFIVVANMIEKLGINLTVCFYGATTLAALTGTVMLFTVGVPSFVVPVVSLGLLCWMASDVFSFTSGYATRAETAEAVARTAGVLFIGVLTTAALMSNPVLGSVLIGCGMAGLLYRTVCSEAGRYSIQVKYASS